MPTPQRTYQRPIPRYHQPGRRTPVAPRPLPKKPVKKPEGRGRLIAMAILVTLGLSYVGYDYVQRTSFRTIPEEPIDFQDFVSDWVVEGFVERVNYSASEVIVNEEIWNKKTPDEQGSILLQMARSFSRRNSDTTLRVTIKNTAGSVLAKMDELGIVIQASPQPAEE